MRRDTEGLDDGSFSAEEFIMKEIRMKVPHSGGADVFSRWRS
jgi:hypothetical protein